RVSWRVELHHRAQRVEVVKFISSQVLDSAMITSSDPAGQNQVPLEYCRRCRPKPNIRVTMGKLEGLHFAEWAKDGEKQNESGVEKRGTTWNCGDFVAPDAKAKSLEVEPTVLSHLDSPDSQFGARYFARGSTSVGFGPEWTVEAHESGAERGSWVVEEGDGAAEVKAAVAWLRRRMKYPAEM